MIYESGYQSTGLIQVVIRLMDEQLTGNLLSLPFEDSIFGG